MEKIEPAVLRGLLGGKMVYQRNAAELCIFNSCVFDIDLPDGKLRITSVKDPMKDDWKGATKPEG